ncbi:hypothetical protein AHiyo8_26890 [Arthrobacter sp. Hiyo8]|nr:hypothetical protein AHiyo8_26890 [Arthrobacter sp. Hiyo8]
MQLWSAMRDYTKPSLRHSGDWVTARLGNVKHPPARRAVCESTVRNVR